MLTNDTSSTVSDLVILTLGKLYQQLRDLMLNSHLIEDSCTIVGDSDITIGGDQNLVETSRTKRSLKNIGDCFSSQDMRL